MSEALIIKGEKCKMVQANGATFSEASEALAPVIDKYLDKDWILQGINVLHDYKNVYLIATISRWKD